MPSNDSFVLQCHRCHAPVASSATPLTLSKLKVFCDQCHEHLLAKARDQQSLKDDWNRGGISWND